MSARNWVRCNNCFNKISNDNVPFGLCKCGHILCAPCGQQIAVQKICVVCKLSTSMVHLNKKIPINISNFFQPIDQLYSAFRKVFQFHAEHRNLLEKNLAARFANMKVEYSRLLGVYKATKLDCEQMHRIKQSKKRQINDSCECFMPYREGSFSDSTRNTKTNNIQTSFNSLLCLPPRNTTMPKSEYFSLSQTFLNKHFPQ